MLGHLLAWLCLWFSSALASLPMVCDTAVIGGGWAGVYAAWRLSVDAKAVTPSNLCLFEARSTVGGRTYTVKVDGLTMDIGAYRFGKAQHLPGDLILHRFNMSTMCYEPDCAPDPEFNQTLYKIVDVHGRNAGYSSPIFQMLKEIEAAGVRVYYHHVLTGVYSYPALTTGSQLHFEGGAVALAKVVLLNLPRATMERLDPMSVVFPKPNTLGYTLLRNCTPCDVPGLARKEQLTVKVYAIYDDPWWVTKLNLMEGTFKSVDSDPPLVGRYHDGPIIQSAGMEVIGPGALEAVYTFSMSNPQISYYTSFAPLRAEDPMSITTDPMLLVPLHRKLMDFHAAAFEKIGINSSTIPQMKHVVLGVWTDDKLAQLPGPRSSNFHAQVPDGCPAEQCLQGVSPIDYYNAIDTPNPLANIHVANNDFAWTDYQGVPCCWAEQSLKPVERTLHKVWSLSKPAWLDSEYYAKLLDLDAATPTVVV